MNVVLKLEAIWWGMRPFFYVPSSILALVTWYAGVPSHRVIPTVALAVAVSLVRGALNLLGDVLDRTGDQVTAPWLPIPSGLLTPDEAAKAVVVLAFTIFGLVYLAAEHHVGRMLLAIGLSGVVGVIGASYSYAKRFGIAGPITISIAQAGAPLAGAILASKVDIAILALVSLYAVAVLFANNILASIRDVDSDGSVGNNTVAVKLGARRAFRFGIALSYVAMLPAAVICLRTSPIRGGAALSCVALAMGWSAYRADARIGLANGRRERSSVIEQFRAVSFWRHLALLCAVSLPAAIVTAIVINLLRPIQERGYQRRIVEGGLLRATQSKKALVHS